MIKSNNGNNDNNNNEGWTDIKRIRKDLIKIVSWHRKEWHKDKEGEKALINMRCKISSKWFMTITEV